MNHLRSLKIGKNSFTKSKKDYEWNQTCSFHLLNCNKLESIEIGPGSFYDYGGMFELKNLFCLLSIKIGEIGTSSSNFFYSSFVVESTITASILVHRSSQFIIHFIRRWCILSIVINKDLKYWFMNEMQIDLPNLKSIYMGTLSLQGRDVSSCSLTLSSNISRSILFRSS